MLLPLFAMEPGHHQCSQEAECQHNNKRSQQEDRPVEHIAHNIRNFEYQPSSGQVRHTPLDDLAFAQSVKKRLHRYCPSPMSLRCATMEIALLVLLEQLLEARVVA